MAVYLICRTCKRQVPGYDGGRPGECPFCAEDQADEPEEPDGTPLESEAAAELARLHAAAGDLLAACEELVAALIVRGGYAPSAVETQVILRAGVAISKAKGE